MAKRLTDRKDSVWDWMGDPERRLLGDVVSQPEEQARWCKAMVFGTLPYMWREKASTVRELLYEKLELRRGARVLLLGECLQVCGFTDDIRERIGPSGEIHEVDITSEARSAYLAGKRGIGGQLATWRWDYTRSLPSQSFDSVAIMQATQHTEDWFETAREMLRLLKPGRPIVIAEITLGPHMISKAGEDLHLQAWVDKIFSRIGWPLDQTPYCSPKELLEAFDGVANDLEIFTWKGLEAFWARSKS